MIFGPTVLEPEAVHQKFLRSDLEFWVPIFIFKKLEPGVSSRLTSGSWFACVQSLVWYWVYFVLRKSMLRTDFVGGTTVRIKI